MDGKYKIKVTSNKGVTKFIKEQYPYHKKGLILTDDYNEATEYDSILEFRVALASLGIVHPWGWNEPESLFMKKDIEKVEAIEFNVTTNNTTLNIEEVDLNKKYPVKTTLYFDEKKFDALKRCMWGSSRWLYDKDDEWVAFPKEDDFERIRKIRYYKRGLTAIISCVFPYRKLKIGINPIPSCYSSYTRHWKAGLTTDKNILKVYLSRYDQCDYFTILPKKT